MNHRNSAHSTAAAPKTRIPQHHPQPRDHQHPNDDQDEDDNSGRSESDDDLPQGAYFVQHPTIDGNCHTHSCNSSSVKLTCLLFVWQELLVTLMAMT